MKCGTKNHRLYVCITGSPYPALCPCPCVPSNKCHLTLTFGIHFKPQLQ